MTKEEHIAIYRFITLEDYSRYKNDMLQMYMDAFTKGENAQYIVESVAESNIHDIIEKGFGVTAFVADTIAGFSLFMPLVYDKDYPSGEVEGINIDESLYVAEVLVDCKYRGKGIATHMITHAVDKLKSRYSSFVLRVWKNNKPALLLYKKLGFLPIATISQIKYKDANNPFEMEKIYLAKLV